MDTRLACLVGLGLLPAIASVLSGCAEIGLSKPTVTPVPIRTRQEEVVRPEGTVATLVVNGPTLTVRASRACDVREVHENRETRVRERVNQSKVLDWVALGGGVALAGSGIAVIADANNVYSNDKTSRTYNDVGPGTARGIGYGLTAAGAALLVIPIVDAFRAQGTTEEVAVSRSPGRPSGPTWAARTPPTPTPKSSSCSRPKC
jgi:hypothetical protein